MITDVIKTLYLFIYKVVFSLFNLLPVQKKIVMYVTFRQNAYYITSELKKRDKNMQIILICNKPSFKRLQHLQDDRIQLIALEDKLLFFKKVFHLATAKIIIVDNYFPFLAATDFKQEVECIQIWHAAGAIKSFGLQANNTFTRTKISIKRFKKVYERFDKIIVGSDEMAAIFSQAFGLEKDVFLKVGIPRTDLFFLPEEQNNIRKNFYKKYPDAKGKKVILYAPTFRDQSHHSIDLNLNTVQKGLGDDYYFMIKLHPVTKQSFVLPEKSNKLFSVIDAEYDVNELLQVTDILITDYSSIPFEFCLLKKPMIFFAYDLEEYIQERGLWKNYEDIVPGPVVQNTDMLINRILTSEQEFDIERNEVFCELWNKYSDGYSSEKLVDYVINKL